MAKYYITVTKTVYYKCLTIEVEADNRKEAKKRALKKAQNIVFEEEAVRYKAPEI